MRWITKVYVPFFLPMICLLLAVLLPIAGKAGDKYNFIHSKGRKLVAGKNDSVVNLRGVCFGNQVWTNEGIPETHHNEEDYKRIRQWGMNTVRFYLNHKTFEKDGEAFTYTQEGWDWLDKNIQWARKHNIRLILNMHVPPGGFQSTGKGDALWNRKINQRRLIHLWKTIAKRYANEPIIAGYDLLNEPHPTRSKQQWEALAQRIAGGIREVDTNHLVVVEQTTAVGGNWNKDKNMNFFSIDDPNVMYTFHFYHPMRYTHQNAEWTPYDNDGKYPDKRINEFDNNLTWHTATFKNPNFNKMSGRWNYYEGKKYQISDTLIDTGKPVLVSRKNTGKVYFGDFVIKEFDPKGRFVRNVMEVSYENERNWNFWSKNGSGDMEITYTKDNYGNDYSKQIMIIRNTTADASAYNNQRRFKVKQGYYYQISGWAKTERKSEDALCQFRIDFEKSPFNPVIFKRNKQYLEHELTKPLAWAKEQQVPMYLGEFGVHGSCFKKRKGGTEWVQDIISLSKKHKLHFTYHQYNGTHMGLYTGYNKLPAEEYKREKLIQTITNSINK